MRETKEIIANPFLLKRRLMVNSLITLGVLLALSGSFTSPGFTFGILTGGGLSILNFCGLTYSLKDLGSSGKTPIILKYLFRLALTGFLLYVLIVNTKVHVIGLILGLSVVLISVIFTLIPMLFKEV